MDAQIFLSYSRNDLEIMGHVRDSLVARGLNIWTDEFLQPGSPVWENEIASAIERSKALIVILTPSARASEWVSRELSYAAEHGIKIFPLLADGTEKTSIPLRLISAQRIDIRTGFASGIRTLVEAIHNHLGVVIIEEQAANAEKVSIFMANALHDIRNPISTIKAKIHLLSKYRDRYDTDKIDSMLENIEDNIIYLVKLIDDVWDISRLDRLLLPMPQNKIEIRTILKSIVEEQLLLAESKGLSLFYHPPEEPVFALIEEHQFRRVILNILGNAINYTPFGGTIDVKIFLNKYNINITIKDNGIGISDKDKPNIFKRFYRADNANSISSHGTGLGLAISKETIEYYRGSIVFESHVGQGTTFTIKLPS